MRTRSQKKALVLKLMMTAGLGLAVALSACATASKPVASLREETATHIANGAHLLRSDIPAGEFRLLAFERVVHPGEPVNVYIDGDGAGHADLSLKGDPTPIEPIALEMAADDGMANVIYLGRPCQFTALLQVRDCTPALYMTHRYSPQILDAMNAGLDNIRRRYGVSAFNLIGFGGGAAIAVELAASRDDIKSIKTVAGVLDTRVMARGWDHDPFAGSLNPIDAAPKVANIRQVHSVAAWDKARSLEMIQNFQAAEGNPQSSAIGAPTSLGSDDNTAEINMDSPPAPDERSAKQPQSLQ